MTPLVADMDGTHFRMRTVWHWGHWLRPLKHPIVTSSVLHSNRHRVESWQEDNLTMATIHTCVARSEMIKGKEGTRTQTHTHMHRCKSAYTHTHTHARTHARTHTRTHTHTQVHNNLSYHVRLFIGSLFSPLCIVIYETTCSRSQ